MMGEAELVVRFAAGEPAGVAEVYRTYGRLVYAVSYRVLGDRGMAEEATKRTFLLARRLTDTLEPGRAFEPWLAAIAGRTAMDIRRGRRGGPAVAAGVPEPVRPIATAESTQEVWLVRRALDALPAQDRELIRLQHCGRLNRKEISERLAIPLGTMKSRSEGAHRNLATQLGRLRAGGHPRQVSGQRPPPLREPQLECG